MNANVASHIDLRTTCEVVLTRVLMWYTDISGHGSLRDAVRRPGRGHRLL